MLVYFTVCCNTAQYEWPLVTVNKSLISDSKILAVMSKQHCVGDYFQPALQQGNLSIDM